MELAEQAASEVRAQRPDCTVDVVLVDGDPSLRVSDAQRSGDDQTSDEDFNARISLRLPPTLKTTIEETAHAVGESVNTWVVEAVGQHAKRNRRPGRRFNQGFDL